MLTYKEAVKTILKNSKPLKMRSIPLREGLGRVLRKDIVAPESFPSFNNSAVDGYAIRLQLKRSNLNFKLQGEVRAGEVFKKPLKPGCAVRIFTGAQVPIGTQAVVMQEETGRMNGHVVLFKRPLPQENIRFSGEDFKKGRVLVRKNTLLNPAHLAVLTSVGYQNVPVYALPKVGILATGSELLKEGEKLKPGKIRDSNTILLEALVEKAGGIPRLLPPIGDDPAKIRLSVGKGLANDLLLISGGVSVGKYDFVKEILKKKGVQEIFWKVDIKPGKPVFLGKKDQTLVFGLPGNPVSVFVTFDEFVKPAMFKMMGKNHEQEKEEIEGCLTKPFQNGSRLHFVRVRWVKGKKVCKVTPLKGQGSHMIGSLAASNGILMVEPNHLLKKNERVSITLI